MWTHARYDHVVCASGLKFSAQASETHYCTPKDNEGPYTEVEIGRLSEPVEKFEPFRESDCGQKYIVYAWVPMRIVFDVIDDNGGQVGGQLPPGSRQRELALCE